jgi:hypothetical protein
MGGRSVTTSAHWQWRQDDLRVRAHQVSRSEQCGRRHRVRRDQWLAPDAEITAASACADDEAKAEVASKPGRPDRAQTPCPRRSMRIGRLRLPQAIPSGAAKRRFAGRSGRARANDGVEDRRGVEGDQLDRRVHVSARSRWRQPSTPGLARQAGDVMRPTRADRRVGHGIGMKHPGGDHACSSAHAAYKDGGPAVTWASRWSPGLLQGWHLARKQPIGLGPPVRAAGKALRAAPIRRPRRPRGRRPRPAARRCLAHSRVRAPRRAPSARPRASPPRGGGHVRSRAEEYADWRPSRCPDCAREGRVTRARRVRARTLDPSLRRATRGQHAMTPSPRAPLQSARAWSPRSHATMRDTSRVRLLALAPWQAASRGSGRDAHLEQRSAPRTVLVPHLARPPDDTRPGARSCTGSTRRARNPRHRAAPRRACRRRRPQRGRASRVPPRRATEPTPTGQLQVAALDRGAALAGPRQDGRPREPTRRAARRCGDAVRTPGMRRSRHISCSPCGERAGMRKVRTHGRGGRSRIRSAEHGKAACSMRLVRRDPMGAATGQVQVSRGRMTMVNEQNFRDGVCEGVPAVRPESGAQEPHEG